MAKLADHTGETFGDWFVLKQGASTQRGATRWVCECQKCKQLKLVRGSHLRSGVSTKCKDCHNKTFNRKHGMYNTSTYKIWEAMVQRCTNPKDRNYTNYGGRGITVCEEWRKDFLNFWADMGERPGDLTLDRIDNERGYDKRNCRWTSRQEQLCNTRRSHRPGDVFGDWKLIQSTPYEKKALFECIRCQRKWMSEKAYITSGRAAPCKCSQS